MKKKNETFKKFFGIFLFFCSVFFRFSKKKIPQERKIKKTFPQNFPRERFLRIEQSPYAA